jgi:hypothetical protein
MNHHRPSQQPRPDQRPGNGRPSRNEKRMTQLKREDLKTMTPEQIVDARIDGRLNTLLGRPLPRDPDASLTVDDLKSMTPAEIVAARKAGDLNHLL